MTALPARLNREKLAFLAGAAVLAGAVACAICSRPESRDPGEHRMSRTAPAELNADLDPRAGTEGVEQFLAGARPNPFSWWSDQSAGQPQPQGTGKSQTIPPLPSRLPSTAQAVTAAPPQPYDMPVSFRGIMATESGELNVLLKTKQTSVNRRLVEGDVWPETGLRIMKITQSSVLLQNDKGERFLMRDLYSRRAADGQPPASGETART